MLINDLIFDILKGRVENPFPNLTGSLITNIKEATDLAIKYSERTRITEEVLSTRESLAKRCKKFHEKCGTLNEDISNSIENLSNPETIIIENAHQPNIFPHIGMVRKFALQTLIAEALTKKGYKVVKIFGVVDQAHANAKYFRITQIPDIFADNGALNIKVNVSKRTFKAMNSIKLPSESEIAHWKESIITSRKNNIKYLNFIEKKMTGKILYDYNKKLAEIESINILFSIINNCYQRASNLSQFNAFFLSNLVNKYFKDSVLFHEYSETQDLFSHVYRKTLEWNSNYSLNIQKIYDQIISYKLELNFKRPEKNIAPFWINCSCGSIVSAYFRDGCLIAENCPECNKPVLNNEEPNWFMVSPRAIYRPILISEAIKPSIFITGTGGSVGFHLISRGLADNYKIPLHPFVMWSGKYKKMSIGKMLANYFIEEKSINNIFNNKDKNILRMSINAKKTLDVSPSILENIIEFGIYKSWNSLIDLLKDGELIKDIVEYPYERARVHWCI